MENKIYAVVSYWEGEFGDTQLWLYKTKKDALDGMRRLYKQSYKLASKDENFLKDESFIDMKQEFGAVCWEDGLTRHFVTVEPDDEEVIY